VLWFRFGLSKIPKFVYLVNPAAISSQLQASLSHFPLLLRRRLLRRASHSHSLLTCPLRYILVLFLFLMGCLSVILQKLQGQRLSTLIHSLRDFTFIYHKCKSQGSTHPSLCFCLLEKWGRVEGNEIGNLGHVILETPGTED